MGENRQINSCLEGNKLQIISGILRKIFIVGALLFISARAAAPGLSVIYIITSEPYDAYEKIIDAVIRVESAGDNLAYNVSEEAFGAFQIRPIRVLDFNQRTGKNYKAEDCFSFEISKEIFLYYAQITGFRDYESIARNWNGSVKLTTEYWNKVKNYL